MNSSALSRPLAAIGAVSMLFGPGGAHALDTGALPQGGTVVGGSATIARSGSTLTVNQSSNRTVIDWRSFDIGAGAQANFNQPGASSIAVNRVGASANPTLIEGGLHANGQVWILNPNGVLFGKGAHVDAAGIVASTANIDPTRFMAGDNRLTLTGADHGMVANDGSISIAANGLAAFVAPSVRNSGVITAKVGRVALAAGTTFTLDLAGDRLVEIGLGAGNAIVDQSGRIVADGGIVTLTAQAAGQVVDSVINMSGVVSTASARQVGGQIVLAGDAVTVTGAMDASGTSGGQISVTGKTIAVSPAATLFADAGVNGDGGAITAVASVSGDYAGAYSARGGSAGGDGGKIETSGKTVQIADGISVDTRAPGGAMGSWTIDPDTLTIGASGAGSISGGVNSEDQTIAASTVVTALNTTSVNLQANTTITVNAAIDTSTQGNSNTLNFRDENADGHLTINLNAPITLGAHQQLTGDGTVVNVASAAGIQNGVDVASATTAATVDVAAGVYTYAAGVNGVTIDKSNLTLDGSAGAQIDIDPGAAQVNAITIAGTTSGVTVKGFKIVGEIPNSNNSNYLTYAFGSGISRGVFAAQNATGFTITGNTILNVRNGILIDGRNVTGASVTGNTIDNTKGALSVQYTDGSGITITGNSQGPVGNEWGENLHLNGSFDGSNVHSNPTSGSVVVASTGVQSALLADSAANGGWSVQDQAYTASNRTSVVVAASGGSDVNQGSARAPLATIQAAIADVVTGGTVNLNDGTYVIASGGANYLDITKSLTLKGASEAGTIIDASNAAAYGLRVQADNVSLADFTLKGSTGGYGIKVEPQETTIAPTDRVNAFSIAHVTETGSLKNGLDLNGVVGGVIDHVTVTGTTAGTGIAITDSANVALTYDATSGNSWGGLALYQHNATYNQQTTNITVDASNSFAEANPVYAEDQSSTNNFGALTIAGFDYIVQSPTNPADVYTWFQKTQQGAIDFAAATAPTTATVQGYAGSGVTGDNVFSVGVSTGGQALSVEAATNAAQAGATVNVAAGSYTGGVSINAADVTLQGSTGTQINVAAGQTGVAINADNVTVSGLEIVGPIHTSYTSTDWTTAGTSNGIVVGGNTSTGPSGFTITDNDIHDIRTGIIVEGNSSSGSITDNTVENTKGGILIQYNNGTPYTIAGNKEGAVGNESGIVLNLNSPNPDVGVAPLPWQASLLALANNNNGLAVMDRQYASANRTRVIVDASSTATAADDFGLGNGLGNARLPLSTIQAGIDAVVTGGTVYVDNGTYVSTVSGGYINVNKSLSLIGQSEAGVIIDARGGSQYGLRVTAPGDVTLENLTVYGVPNAYGVKVETITGLNISNVASQGSGKSEFDLNSVTDGVLDNLTANGAPVGGGADTAGNGISITDSQNVTLTNSTTLNNAWGGLALYQTNNPVGGSLLQEDNITVAANNSFAESVPLYAENTSTINDFGTLNILGFDYIVRSPTNPADVVTVFQKTAQEAIDYAAATAPATAWVQGYGSGVTGNNIFTVGVGSGGQAMSIQAALVAAQTGATVNVNDGDYVIGSGGDSFLTIDKSLSLVGQSETGVIIDARNADTYGIRVTAADDVSISNLTVYGVDSGSGYGVKVEGTSNLTLSNITSQGAAKSEFDLNGVVGGTLDHLTADGAPVGGGADTGGNGISITDSQNLTLTNVTTQNNGWGGVALYQTNRPGGFTYQVTNITIDGSNNLTEANPLYLEDQSTTNNYGVLNLTGFNYIVQSPTNPADVYTWFQKTEQGAIDFAAATAATTATVQGYSGTGLSGNNVFDVGFSTGGQALSLQTAENAAQAGATINVGSGAYAENVVVGTEGDFNFGNVSLTGFTLQSTAAGSGLSGSLAANSITLSGAVKLLGALTLDTSAANGSITTAAIDDSTAGGDSLTLKVGTGAASLGALGATTRLGATQIAGAATLTGATYNANSLLFGGATTLTAATTTFNTSQGGAAGNITVSGSLLGTTNGGQSLVLIAGPGTGAANTNADILLQNVGASALRLNSLTITGDDFGAQTVDLAGNFSAKLVGNQVFSSHTLNAGGAVSSTVGGSASGPINATGSVNVAVTGNLTGAITGTNVALSAGVLTGATVTASQSASISAGAVTSSTLAAGQTVNVSANSVQGSSFSSTQDVNLTAGSVAGSSFNAAQNVNLNATSVAGSSFTASQGVNVSAQTVTSSSLTAPVVVANADTFDANVAASNGATISGGNVSGVFTGGSVAITGTGSVNATVTATNVSVQSPQGTLSGTWQNLTTSSGNGGGGGGGFLVNGAPPGGNSGGNGNAGGGNGNSGGGGNSGAGGGGNPGGGDSGGNGNSGGGANGADTVNPSQIVVQNFALPVGSTVTATGEIVLPQGLVIGLLSPGGAGGAPKLIQVQSVQDLGSLLAGGYTAIVIDLSGHSKGDKKKDDKDDKKDIRLSAN